MALAYARWKTTDPTFSPSAECQAPPRSVSSSPPPIAEPWTIKLSFSDASAAPKIEQPNERQTSGTDTIALATTPCVWPAGRG